jgi:predicted phosphoribosyltransferase
MRFQDLEDAGRCLAAELNGELYAIGIWYEDFRQVTQEEVARLLERSRGEASRGKSQTCHRMSPGSITFPREELVACFASS